MLEYVAPSFAEFLNIMEAIADRRGRAKSWWRGQSVAEWDLLPSVYRGQPPFDEENLTFHFLNLARSRHSRCPQDSDFGSWLFLMQHYRLPTRILDWSLSPLVAAHFVVANAHHDDRDGAIWALTATRLNV